MLDFDPAVFAAAILDQALPLPDGIVESGGISREDRFAVHRNNVVQGLIAALETRFPMVRRVVGETFFAAAAHLYALQNPPHSPIMAFYGEDFPNFLAHFEPCAELPYLADLARLEAARTRAYHAADATPLSQEALASLAPGDLISLRVTLHPSLSIVSSPYPVATIFAMNSGDLPLAAIEDWQSEDVFVARPATTVEVRRLNSGGALFLTRLSEAATLAEAADAALAAEPDFDLTVNLAGLIRFGLITEISATPSPVF